MKKLILLTISLLIGVFLLLFISQIIIEHHNTFDCIFQIVKQYGSVFLIWRFVLYGLIVLLWPRFIQKIAKRQQWSAEAIDYLTHQRLKLLMLFIIVEVFFVNNLVGHFIGWL